MKESSSALVTRHSLREGRSRLRVLLAEDNAVNQLLAVRLLEKCGHEVVVAENGRKALETLDRESFDLVLMDIQMPEMDGWEATQAIRVKEKTAGGRLPIVAMTAHAMEGDEERCLAAGMDEYLTKPIRTADLLAVLDKIGARKLGPAAVKTATTPALNRVKSALDLPSVLNRLGGDRDLLDELVEVFKGECPKLMERIRVAIARQDAQGLEGAAHSLKGSSAQVGALAVSQIASEIERLARSQNVESTREHSRLLQNEIERLFAELESIGQGE
jgi:CheY-like chemotaxis protein